MFPFLLQLSHNNPAYGDKKTDSSHFMCFTRYFTYTFFMVTIACLWPMRDGMSCRNSVSCTVLSCPYCCCFCVEDDNKCCSCGCNTTNVAGYFNTWWPNFSNAAIAVELPSACHIVVFRTNEYSMSAARIQTCRSNTRRAHGVYKRTWESTPSPILLEEMKKITQGWGCVLYATIPSGKLLAV